MASFTSVNNTQNVPQIPGFRPLPERNFWLRYWRGPKIRQLLDSRLAKSCQMEQEIVCFTEVPETTGMESTQSFTTRGCWEMTLVHPSLSTLGRIAAAVWAPVSDAVLCIIPKILGSNGYFPTAVVLD
ncbi:hypothetical protein J6590_097121 [Homalodisca vitripennis]|nr:hypothetical protein J6590_097121 [Homalodisca vitripennis]